MNFEPIYLQIASDIPCFWQWLLASLGAFLLGTLLNWLFFTRGKQSVINQLTADNDRLKADYSKMEAEVGGLKYKIEQGESALSDTKKALRSCEADKDILKWKLEKAQADDSDEGDVDASNDQDDNANPSTEEDSTTATNETSGDSVGRTIDVSAMEAKVTDLPYAGIFESDNLQIVEGIGPKIEGLLKGAGINTWGGLAAAKYDDLKKILADAGSRYRMHDPKSWSDQARLADTNKWDELVKYQKFLDAGRASTGDFNNPSKVEKLGMKILGFSNNPEDLKIVEGIGPKIEGLLKNEKIDTWADLAATKVEKLQDILNKAGERYRLAKPATWPKQAELAAAGKWSELSEYQDFLDGGKEPGK